MDENTSDADKEVRFFDEEQVSELFHKLDVNRDGRIDVNELSDGLKRLGIHHVPGQAEQIIEIGDITDDDHLSFDEFLKYCASHEQKLWLIFKSIDSDGSGSVSQDELKMAFHKLGVEITKSEVDTLFKKMDTNGSLAIDWEEWKKFHLLNPHAHNMHDILKFWRHSSFIDVGDDMTVPDELTEEERQSGMWWRQLLSGGVAGVVSRSFTAPLDRLKILLQIQSSNRKWSIQRGFKKMYTEGGLRSLWRGNMVNCIKIAPESSIKFFAYERLKKMLKKENAPLGVSERFIAGSSAGICAQFSIYPMEVMKTRLAIGKTGQYKGLFDCARKVFFQHGFKGFYKGLVPGLIGVVPYAGIDLCVYETLKNRWLKKHDDTSDPGTLVLLSCGAISCTCGMCASYPLSLVRTKLQAQSNDPSFEGHRARGMGQMFKLIVKENGVVGLYRGIFPNFLKVAPAVSVSYLVYERTRSALGVT